MAVRKGLTTFNLIGCRLFPNLLLKSNFKNSSLLLQEETDALGLQRFQPDRTARAGHAKLQLKRLRGCDRSLGDVRKSSSSEEKKR